MDGMGVALNIWMSFVESNETTIFFREKLVQVLKYLDPNKYMHPRKGLPFSFRKFGHHSGLSGSVLPFLELHPPKNHRQHSRNHPKNPWTRTCIAGVRVLKIAIFEGSGFLGQKQIRKKQSKRQNPCFAPKLGTGICKSFLQKDMDGHGWSLDMSR